MQSPVPEKPELPPDGAAATVSIPVTGRPQESGGPPGPEPTRYGDWEKGGRCIDF